MNTIGANNLKTQQKPSFTSIYATKGPFVKNQDFAGHLIKDFDLFAKEISRSPQKITLDILDENIYQFDVIQLTPIDEKNSIQLIATNKDTPILSKFAKTHQYKFDFDIMSGEKLDCFEVQTKNMLKMGEIDEYLDYILERRKSVSTEVTAFDIAKKVVKELRRSTEHRLGYIPIIDTEKALEFCKKHKFNFAKGIIK